MLDNTSALTSEDEYFGEFLAKRLLSKNFDHATSLKILDRINCKDVDVIDFKDNDTLLLCIKEKFDKFLGRNNNYNILVNYLNSGDSEYNYAVSVSLYGDLIIKAAALSKER